MLAWAGVAGDSPAVIVVTTFGLWLPGRTRLGWHLIHKATWSGSRLTVVPASPASEPVALDGVSYTVMADDEPLTVQLTEPGDVPGAVRQRVTRSVAYTAHHPLTVGGVRVVARRVAGADGLAWHVRYDEGTPADDPAVATRTAELVTEAAVPTHAE
jgi:hypothetical protein